MDEGSAATPKQRPRWRVVLKWLFIILLIVSIVLSASTGVNFFLCSAVVFLIAIIALLPWVVLFFVVRQIIKVFFVQ